MKRDTYYVSMQSREISKGKFYNNHHYKICATEDEVKQLRRLFNQIADADNDAYWRAHIPFKHYHHDMANDSYDEKFTEALQFIYQLGDEQTRAYIDTTGVLDDRSLDMDRPY